MADFSQQPRTESRMRILSAGLHLATLAVSSQHFSVCPQNPWTDCANVMNAVIARYREGDSAGSGLPLRSGIISLAGTASFPPLISISPSLLVPRFSEGLHYHCNAWPTADEIQSSENFFQHPSLLIIWRAQSYPESHIKLTDIRDAEKTFYSKCASMKFRCSPTCGAPRC